MKVRDVFIINPSSKRYKDFINYIDTSSVQSGKLINVQYLDSEFPSRAQREIKFGDIVYSSVRPNLRHYLLYASHYEHAVGSSGFVLLRSKNDTYDRVFGYYYLSTDSVVNYLSNIAELSQATFPSFSPKDMGKINLPDVKLDTQRRIASILSTYDNLIENNTKRIKLLEQMAENLYKEWFVRFRFPGHENVEMENGLPKGWTVEKVCDWCRVFTGKKDVNQTVADGKYVFFSCSPDIFHSNEYIFEGKAIIVAGNGSYTGRTRYYEGKFDLYQRTYAIVSSQDDDSFIPYLFARFKFDFEPTHSGGTRGSAIPYIVMKDLTKYKFFYNKDIVDKFMLHITPMFEQIDNLQQQTTYLTRQRDLLLPRLMSGKLEVVLSENCGK